MKTTRRSALLLSAATLLPAAASATARAKPSTQPLAPASPTIVTDPGAARAAAFAASLEKRVVDFTLPSNGMRFIVLERPASAASPLSYSSSSSSLSSLGGTSTSEGTGNAPVVSLVTYAAVGAFDEPEGSTGIAHLLEHMAFKGTSVLGAARNTPAAVASAAASPASSSSSAAAAAAADDEESLLAAADEAFYELRRLKDEARANAAEAAAEAADSRRRASSAASPSSSSSDSFSSSPSFSSSSSSSRSGSSGCSTTPTFALSSKQKRAIAAAEARLDAAAAAAERAAQPNAYGALLSREGALGLNASTSHDATRYYVSLPSNKLELWFAMEAGRFRAPVWRVSWAFRSFLWRERETERERVRERKVEGKGKSHALSRNLEFLFSFFFVLSVVQNTKQQELYTEKKVVAEERRARIDAAPLGSFQQKFLRRALANNYGRPVIGFPEDVDRVGRKELDAFFRSRYVPSSLTVAVVGDAPAARVRQLAEKYFGDWRVDSSSTSSPSSPHPSSIAPPRLVGSAAPTARPTTPPERLIAAERGGPLVLKAYYRPAGDSPDAVAVDAAADVLSGGRSSRLYKSLVLPRLALTAGCSAAIPGDLRPCASLLSAVPSPGVDLEDVDKALTRAALALAADAPTDTELERARKGARAALYAAARSNHGMATLLATNAGERGTWRALLTDLAALENLKAADVEAAAGRVFAADGNGATAWAKPAAERVDFADVLIS